MVEIRKYMDEQGGCPFDDWLEELRDRRAAARILVRLNRLEMGLEGDSKSVGEGVRELRITEGKGYRVYYGWVGDTAVLLLCGGDKRRQDQDIEQAKRYWRQLHEQ